MAYKHGVYTSEVPTSIVPPVSTEAGLPVFFGTAPVHLASDRAKANRPVLCHTYEEAVEQLGYSADWEKYTLCEAIYSQFALYARSPVIFVNVLDPDADKKHVDVTSVIVNDGKAVVSDAVLLDTLKVMKTAESQPAELGTDYLATYDDDEKLNIAIVEGGALAEASEIYISYDALDASKVTAADIIGGVDGTTGELKGLGTLNQVYPLYGLVPALVAAPGWSDKPEVAAIMASKADNINGLFHALAVVDIPTDTVKKYTDASEWKNKNNYVQKNEIVAWPMVKMGDKVYHLSTHIIGVMNTVDSNNDDVPYESPSNKTAQINGACLKDGTEVVLGLENANYLNSQGLVTVLNFIGGWRIWGNRTGCYPANTDAKDAFIPIRRMFSWEANRIILSSWQFVDKPGTRRMIHTIMDSENIDLNGLTAAEKIYGGQVEFRDDENPDTALLDGIFKFHVNIAPPPPARDIDFVLEYDTSYIKQALLGSAA